MRWEAALQDLRFGARTLRRQPGFAAVAILTLGLGIGANAAIFSVVKAVLLAPLPWRAPAEAVMIWSRWTAFDKTWVATGEVVDYRRRARTLSAVGAWAESSVNLTGTGEPERVPASAVTANLWDVLGVAPQIGRGFTSEEDLPNGPAVALIGHDLWVRRFAADPAVVGRTIQIEGRPSQIVGVMPRGFVLPTDFERPSPSELWVPLQIDPASTDHGSHGLYAAARLAPGATVAQASDELHRIARDLTAEGFYPPAMQFDTVTLSLEDEVVGGIRRAVWLLTGAVGFLLLIACANVANLLLVRAEARQREMAVRSAIGAGGWRVARQLFTESLVLAAVSGVAGILLAVAGVRLLAWWNPAGIPRLATATVDLPVVLATAGLTLLTTVIFSLAPALRVLRLDLTEALKDGSHGASGGPGRQRFRSALVVVQMALSVILLIGAGLMLRSLASLQSTPLGFEPEQVLTLRVSLPAATYDTPDRVVAFYGELVERVRQLPGVRAAGAARALPLASTIGDFGLTVDGYDPPPGTGAKGDWQIVTDGYVEAIGERLIGGRTFTTHDTPEAQLVALVNEEMARRYWPGRDPIGGRFRIGRNPERPWVTVVGVVADVRHNGLTEPVKEKFYVPHAQWHRSTGNPLRAMTLVVKATAADDRAAAALTRPIRDIIAGLDPDLPVSEVRTMEGVVAATLSAPRFTGALLGLFAGLALALASVGIYGVLAYLVTRRRREIGIRLAIGAGRWRVLALVLRNGLAMALAGVAIGLAVAWFGAGLMRGLLHGVAPGDPLTFALAAVVLPAVALIASVIPAWRASRVSPMIALRGD